LEMKNGRAPVISVVAAKSGTGKTTLIEKIIAILASQGYATVTLKHVHNATLDLSGKDSWRHRQAGALAVGLVATQEYTIIGNKDYTEAPLALLPCLPKADLVIMEGFRHLALSVPQIEVVRKEMGTEMVASPEQLIAVATDVPDLVSPAPCFPLNDPTRLVEWLIQHLLQKPGDEDHLTHLDLSGKAKMVDVTNKDLTMREAVARGEIRMKPHTLSLLQAGKLSKGDVLAVARVAALMGVKETSRLIPMCHPLNVSGIAVDFKIDEPDSKVEIEVRVKLAGQTGVEMEALTGVSIAALTIYDMCKAVDKEMEIGRIRLMEKTGGKSGTFIREEEDWEEL
jgi:cyclic pyranopterin phosphate synthase